MFLVFIYLFFSMLANVYTVIILKTYFLKNVCQVLESYDKVIVRMTRFL